MSARSACRHRRPDGECGREPAIQGDPDAQRPRATAAPARDRGQPRGGERSDRVERSPGAGTRSPLTAEAEADLAQALAWYRAARPIIAVPCGGNVHDNRAIAAA